jgi:hypothetical protein
VPSAATTTAHLHTICMGVSFRYSSTTGSDAAICRSISSWI